MLCGFDTVTPETLDQRVTCTLFDGTNEIAMAEVDVDDPSGGSNPAFRVFAGLRADPFFTDAIRIRLPDSISTARRRRRRCRPRSSR